MDTPPPIQKKGIGALGWIGIGCGGIIVLIIIGFVAFGLLFGGKLKQFAEDAQKDPTRTMATTMVTVSIGEIEMVAEDAANKRYTVREKKTGKLTTMYWNEKEKKVEVIPGDFSAIPAEATETRPPAPAPAPGASTGTIDRAVSDGVSRLEKK
jgi:hypothetical protein